MEKAASESNLSCGQCINERLSLSVQKNNPNASFCSATCESSNSIQPVAPWFRADEAPERDTLLFKCREAIESLQEEIEDYQNALNERDFLLSQAQEREENLVSSKKNINKELESTKDKLEKAQEELVDFKKKASGNGSFIISPLDNEEKYEDECHKLIEENKQLKLENIEMESKHNKNQIKLESIEESLNDLKVKKSNLENSNEKLEGKIKDLKLTISEYETANHELDTKLIWAEK